MRDDGVARDSKQMMPRTGAARVGTMMNISLHDADRVAGWASRIRIVMAHRGEAHRREKIRRADRDNHVLIGLGGLPDTERYVFPVFRHSQMLSCLRIFCADVT